MAFINFNKSKNKNGRRSGRFTNYPRSISDVPGSKIGGSKVSNIMKKQPPKMSAGEYALRNLSPRALMTAARLGMAAYKGYKNWRKKGRGSYIGPSPNGGITFSKFRGKILRRKSVRKILWKNASLKTYINSASAQITALNGTTSVYDPIVLSQSIYARGFNLILNGNINSSVAAADYNKRVFIKQFTQVCTFTNGDFSTCLIDLYFLRPRSIATNGPKVLWDNSMAAGSGSDELGSGSAINGPNITPYQSRSLCSEYKIVSRKRIELQPGCTHQLSYKLPLYTRMTGRELAEMGTFYSAYYFRPCLMFTRGTPVQDSATLTNVSMSKVKLNLVTHYSIQGVLLDSDPLGGIYSTTALPAITGTEVVLTDVQAQTD